MADIIVQNDGSLVCDIDATGAWNLQYETPTMGLSVLYPEETIWKLIGEEFLINVQAWCPVDTGFMRDHNHFETDQGGITFYSDATYSVYQEYGTSRMAAQPWFERSIDTAIEKFTGQAQKIYNQHLQLEAMIYKGIQYAEEAEFVDIYRATRYMKTAIGCMRKAKQLAIRIQYPTDQIDKLKYEFEMRLQELMVELQLQQEMQQQEGEMAGEALGAIGLDLFDFEGDDEDEWRAGPVGQSIIQGVEGATDAFLQYNWDAFFQGLIGPGEFLANYVIGFGFALIGTIIGCVISDIFDYDPRDHARSRGGIPGLYGFYTFIDRRDTTHHARY